MLHPTRSVHRSAFSQLKAAPSTHCISSCFAASPPGLGTRSSFHQGRRGRYQYQRWSQEEYGFQRGGAVAAAIATASLSLSFCEKDSDSKRSSWLFRGRLSSEYQKHKDHDQDGKQPESHRPKYEHHKGLEPGSLSRRTAEEHPRSFGAGPPMKGAHGEVDVSHVDEDKRKQNEAHVAKEVGGGIQPGVKKEGLPTYSLEEVQKHTTDETGVWVIYKHGVYDITEFRHRHPGGASKINLGAGKSIEPFWELYSQHKKQEVYKMLEELRIGNLADEDVHRAAGSANQGEGPYADEPTRHPALIQNSETPCNAEPPLNLLADNFLTPNGIFFIRNHLPVPKVDKESYRLQIEVPGRQEPLSFSLDDLKTKFKPVKVTATLQCAGNRRNELNSVEKVKGLTWGSAAISTAEWKGVRLRDVLTYAGLSESSFLNFDDPYATQHEHDSKTVRHICFEGLDKDPEGKGYGASIPVSKAMNPCGDVILAYEMNGEELPRDHGFPLRVVAPGHVGARNVKWLSKIVAAPQESNSHWQKHDYKGFCPSTTWDTIDWDSSPPIQEAPVTSAICDPEPNTVVDHADEEITLRGYSWSGGGRNVIRVDVSTDGGKTWNVADLDEKAKKQPNGQAWAWVPWEATVKIPQDLQFDENGKAELEVCCKATDSSYNTQPETPASVWNLRGVLNNSFHRVPVIVRQNSEDVE